MCKKFEQIIQILFHQETFRTIDGIAIPNINPQQMPVMSTAAPNIPAIALNFFSTQLKQKKINLLSNKIKENCKVHYSKTGIKKYSVTNL